MTRLQPSRRLFYMENGVRGTNRVVKVVAALSIFAHLLLALKLPYDLPDSYTLQ
jgi:hypothetical protein